jgi:hypothetical protein
VFFLFMFYRLMNKLLLVKLMILMVRVLVFFFFFSVVYGANAGVERRKMM